MNVKFDGWWSMDLFNHFDFWWLTRKRKSIICDRVKALYYIRQHTENIYLPNEKQLFLWHSTLRTFLKSDNSKQMNSSHYYYDIFTRHPKTFCWRRRHLLIFADNIRVANESLMHLPTLVHLCFFNRRINFVPILRGS